MVGNRQMVTVTEYPSIITSGDCRRKKERPADRTWTREKQNRIGTKPKKKLGKLQYAIARLVELPKKNYEGKLRYGIAR